MWKNSSTSTAAGPKHNDDEDYTCAKIQKPIRSVIYVLDMLGQCKQTKNEILAKN